MWLTSEITIINVVEPDYYPMNEKSLDIGLKNLWRKVGDEQDMRFQTAGGKPHK